MKTKLFLSLTFLSLTCAALAADPWADTVVNYTPGTGVPSIFGSDPPVFYDQEQVAIGAPTRNSISHADGNSYVVSPYRPAANINEIVSLGAGGSLTVSFDEPVENDPDNPYGIDLLIFGNASLYTSSFSSDPAGGEINSNQFGSFNEPGVIEISSDGINFTEVTGIFADTFLPTRGYVDGTVGTIPTDFTLPANPGFDPVGKTVAETYAAYGNSGGGTGVDIGSFGFSQISYVRVSNPIGSSVTPEIDAFADVSPVPEPSSLLLLLAALPLAARRN